jgi:hypothetical protein
VAGEEAVKLKRAKRRRGSALEQWEVAIVKAMLAKQDRTDQDILAYFTRPTRSVNHRLIGQIRKGTVHAKRLKLPMRISPGFWPPGRRSTPKLASAFTATNY